MPNALITIDGVLAQRGKSPTFAGSKVVMPGLMLYRSLCSTMNVTLVSLQEKVEQDRVIYWLSSHGLVQHADIYWDNHQDNPGRSVQAMLDELRYSGSVDLVVDADPERAAKLVHYGAPTFLFSNPHYSRGEFHPGSRPVPREWGSLLGELDEQAGLSESDSRVSEGVGGNRFEED